MDSSVSPAAVLDKSEQTRGTAATLRHALWWTCISLAAFLAAEAALFRLPWYYKYVEPNSSTGAVELRMYWLQHFRPSGKREVLAIGDSRVAEAFSTKQAAGATAGSGLFFWNAGTPSTTPRVWYYMLRDADPQHNRFQAIVIGMDRYTDQDLYDDVPDRLLDLNLAIGRLRYADAWDFASSMRSTRNKEAALEGVVLKGSVLKRDLQEGLSNIRKRRYDARDWREHGLDYITVYPGRDGDLRGLSVDWNARTISFPASLTEQQRGSIKNIVMPRYPPQAGNMTRFRIQWFARILDLYRNSPTRLIFVEMPRAPVPLPQNHFPTTSLDWVRAQQRSNVSVIGAATFHDLETPELFFDALHLNARGRALFSPRLAALVMAQLSPH